MAKQTKNILTVGIALGYSVDKMSKQVSDKMKVNYSNAKRLIRTESNYILSEATHRLYKDVELEKYQFIATLDYKTSEICQSLDNKIFLVKDRQIGLNCNPMHPNCRSTTIPYIEEYQDENDTRIARDIDGRNYKVPANYDYKAWYESMSDADKEEMALARKMHFNYSMDEKQYNKYKEVLGNNVPESIEKFQRMKYTDDTRYELIKIDYARRNRLIRNKDLALPNVEYATIDDRKFTNYLFGGSIENGLNKGRLITEKLGYNIDNYKEFRNIILEKAKQYPAKYKKEDSFGKKYEQKIFIYDKNGVPVNLEVGWQVVNEKTHMSSMYITEVKNDNKTI